MVVNKGGKYKHPEIQTTRLIIKEQTKGQQVNVTYRNVFKDGQVKCEENGKHKKKSILGEDER